MCQGAGIATSRDQAEKTHVLQRLLRACTCWACLRQQHTVSMLGRPPSQLQPQQLPPPHAQVLVACPRYVACFLPCHPPTAGPTRTTAAAAARGGPPPPGVSALDPHTATCQSCCPCHVAPPAPSLPCGTRRTVCVLQLGSHPRSGTTYVPVPRQLIAWRIQLASSRLLCHIDSGLPPNATPPSPPHRHSSLALAYLQQQHGGEG